MKILIAEDDPTIRANLGRTLRLEGFDVLAAENGRAALALARQQTPALVLSDVMMPELDGHGLLAALRADPETAAIPVVFLTARADRTDIREGMNLGADDYLTKPFQRDELLAMVRAQLARHATREQANRKLQQEAQQLRQTDMVTGLPNRPAFCERVSASLQLAERNRTRLAVASVVLAELPAVRQSLGQRAAEAALRQAANRLFERVQRLAANGHPAAVARIGDDRFAVLLEDAGDDAGIEHVLRDLVQAAAEPVDGEGRSLFLAPSAGISVCPGDASDLDTLLQHAEAAEPEPGAGGTLAFYSTEQTATMSRRMQLLQALHTALERGELSLVYQPQLATAEETVVGFEALLRWHHPEFAHVSPAEFIPLAEESGLIVPIGAWVLKEAAMQMQDWLNAGFGPMRIAINLSTRQFEDDDLVGLVAMVLRDSGLPPHALELEITESIAMQSAERTLETLRALKKLGIALAMDDFGTGYSSLAYLKRYPLDALKVDQVFVRHLTTDAGDAAIVRAVVALAHSLKMAVVAEGVETQAHVDFLASIGCEICQGYHFSKPMAAEDATDWLMAMKEASA